MNPETFIFLASYFDIPEKIAVYPQARADEIASCGSEYVRMQKDFVWRILKFGVEFAWKRDFCGLNLRKNDNGKWECDEGYLSLSHSAEGVAVALSQYPVGIDREELSERFTQRLFEKIACPAERRILEGEVKIEEVAALWTKKESLFKRDGGRLFFPAGIDTTASPTLTFRRSNTVVSIAYSGGIPFTLGVVYKRRLTIENICYSTNSTGRI